MKRDQQAHHRALAHERKTDFNVLSRGMTLCARGQQMRWWSTCTCTLIYRGLTLARRSVACGLAGVTGGRLVWHREQ